MNDLQLFHEKINPVHTVVLIVDVQNDFVHEEGSLAKAGRDVRPAQAVIPVIETLIEKARENGVRIIWVRTEHAPWTNSSAWLGRIQKKQNIQHFPICSIDSWGSEIYRLKIKSEDIMVIKHRYSAFLNTDLDLILRSLEIRTVIIAGVTTNVCVESTAREAVMRDYYTIVLSDCTAADSEEEHTASLYTFEHYFGIVTTSSEIIKTW